MPSDNPGLDSALALRRFASPRQLDEQLAGDVAAALRDALNLRGSAALAVSGGTTPLGLFDRLANIPLAWERITVTLVDDRWLPASHADSNAGLAHRHLLRGAAAAARWVGLVGNTPTAAAGFADSQAAAATLPATLDVVLLGMGNDGHTASLFPCAENVELALDPACTGRLAIVRPQSAPYERISLTLPMLAGARHLWLHILGEAKWKVLTGALAESPARLPIARVLAAAGGDRRVYWSPGRA